MMTLVLRRRRGFVILAALSGLLILLVVSALYLQHGLQGLRQERMQDLAARCDQIAMSLRDLSTREGKKTGDEMREIAIADLLPPGAEGAAWLGRGGGPDGPRTVTCRIRIERGRERLDRTFAWPAE